jgi:AraC-like DNA-binding protein
MKTRRQDDGAVPDLDCFNVARQSLAWEYEGGSHDYRLRHDTSDWRLLPFLVVVCTVEGEYLAEIEGDGLRTIRAGQSLLVPAGVRHKVGIPRLSTVHHAHIQFTMFNSVDVLAFFGVPHVVGGSAGQEIARNTAELHRIMSGQPVAALAVGKAVAAQHTAFRLLDRIVSVSEPSASGFDRLGAMLRINPVLRHIDQNLAEPLDRGKLAHLASLSESRLHEVFREAMGSSPMAHVRRVRMRQAQRLLANPALRIGEIGERVGYPDAFHFSKTFKAETGLNPRRYRDGLRRWFADGQA